MTNNLRIGGGLNLGTRLNTTEANPVSVESAPDFGGEQYCQNLPTLFMSAVKIMQTN